ncbi:MAG: DUF4175 family protein [candidate division Zixibacteria bacterium]|nr:DUF4175 family protein [candidate division Zixibacteria bacterium]
MSPMPGYDQLIAQLAAMRRKAITLTWASHVGVLLAGISLAFVALTLVMALAVPSVTLRVAIIGLIGAGILGVLVYSVLKTTVLAPKPTHLALAVEREHPELKNRLIAALQLANHARNNPEHYSLALVDLTVRQATELCRDYDFNHALDRERVKRSARWAGIGLGAALIIGLLFPGLTMRSFEAYSNPTTDFAPPIPYGLQVEPGSVEAVKFDDFKITARVNGQDLPRTVTIHHRTLDGDWRIMDPVPPVGAGNVGSDKDALEFRQVLPQIKHDFEYYVTAGELTSPTYAVTAVDRPRVNALRVEVFPPKYTNVEPTVFDENDGAINAPVGSVVKMRLESNRDLATAAMKYSDGGTEPLEVKSKSATVEFTVTKNRSYHFQLVDESGRTNPHPIEYPIVSREDRSPSVEIAFPGHNVDLDDNMAVDLKIVARDDYGFSDMTLHTRWVSEGRERAVREFEIPGTPFQGERLETGHFWDLAGWGLLPEDMIHYYVEVTDNDQYNGPKTATSKTYTVRLPSLDEMIAEYENERDQGIQSLEEVFEGERELAKQIEELRREIANEQQIDWEKQEELKDVAAKGHELEKQLDEIAENLQENLEQAQEQRLQSMEMLQKMAEAQELFQEVATEDMRESMRKLQEAMDKLDPNEVQRALDEMQMSTEDMLERLDRTIAYFKRLQAEQKVDAFVRRLEEMVKQQESINDEAGHTQKEQLPNLAPSQDRLKENFEEFAEEMAAAESLLTANQVSGPEKVSEFCKSAGQCGAPQKMQQASQSMQNQDQQGAQKSGGESKEEMASLLEEMKEFQSQMASRLQQQVAKELREALDKSMYLSEGQEDLLSQTEQLDPNSMSLREMAAQQEALRSATQRLSQDIGEIAKKSTCLGGGLSRSINQSLEQMGQAAQSLSERRGSSARHSQGDAMYGLNSTAQQIIEGMNKNNSQCNKGGSMCEKPGKQGAFGKMQSLAQRQGRLNQQMPGQGAQGQQPGMSESERQALSRLKAEQEAIRKGVEDVHSDIGEDQNDMLGRLDHLAEEMKRVVEAMEESEVTEETRERQRKIYTRMLDFQHSLEKQDYKEQRKARFGDDILRASPGPLDEMRGLTDEDYDRILTRYQEEGYPPEYEETIKEYFRALVESRK